MLTKRTRGKRQLEKLGVKFSCPLPRTVEFSWTEGGYSQSLRVTAINEFSEFSVAAPGLGGTFNLSYQYLAQLPLRGTGLKALRARISDSSRTINRYVRNRDEIMVDLLANMINVARHILICQGKETGYL